MPFLLDTTALSELTKPLPNSGFLSWMSTHSAAEAFVSALSIGELEIGIRLLGATKRRRTLEAWLQNLIDEFEGRILSFDVASARIWGRAVADARLKGRTLPSTDSQIAATACSHGLTIVTRNVRHFDVAAFGALDVANPWSAQ
ncbi:MAG TPA: type II toxin-antitoxin system VapC family toxin [Candidatus Baltobacteraceae bacterium]